MSLSIFVTWALNFCYLALKIYYSTVMSLLTQKDG